MVDGFSERYGDLLTGSYDCVDRIGVQGESQERGRPAPTGEHAPEGAFLEVPALSALGRAQSAGLVRAGAALSSRVDPQGTGTTSTRPVPSSIRRMASGRTQTPCCSATTWATSMVRGRGAGQLRRVDGFCLLGGGHQALTSPSAARSRSVRSSWGRAVAGCELSAQAPLVVRDPAVELDAGTTGAGGQSPTGARGPHRGFARPRPEVSDKVSAQASRLRQRARVA